MFTIRDLEDAFPHHRVEQPELGAGTYKVAYRAHRDGSDLVLKITRNPVPSGWERADGVGAEGRIAQELRILQTVNSPRVVGLLGGPAVIRIAGQPYLYYEETYLPGGTLADKLSSGPLNVDQVISVGLDALAGIAALWDQMQVVHRDIKPNNIGIDEEGRAVLFDLGTAYDPFATDQTDTGDIAPKTNMYAAPEQFAPRAGSVLDFRTDIFSLGVSLLEARLARHPFIVPAMSLADYFSMIQATKAKDLIAMGVEEPLARALARCVQFNISRRYGTVEALRNDLEAAA